jgi:hypothetical protein
MTDGGSGEQIDAARATHAAALGASIACFVDPPLLKAVLAALGVSLGVWMYRLPSRDR